MNPIVSVLMPVYNGQNYLGEAIQSILNQSFQDFELLIMDDASTDYSVDIARSFHDPRIHIMQFRQHQGIAHALNQGLEASQGVYVARMDADDVSLSDRLRLQIQFLESHPAVILCGTAANVMHSDTVWRQPVDPQVIRCELLFRCCMVHPSVMFRRKPLVDEGYMYDPLYTHAEDYDLWVRLSEHFSLSNLPAPLLKYRLHSGQTTKIQSNDQRNKVRLIHRRQLALLGIMPTEEELDIHGDPWLHQGSPALNQWLDKLLEGNATYHIYPQPVFEEVIRLFSDG